MTLQELIERLADKEHASWSRWQKYLHSKCERLYWGDNCCGIAIMPGDLIIPEGLVERWEGQIKTPYAQLSEKVKESDRNEVREILPDIYEFGRSFLNDGVALGHLPPIAIHAWNSMFEEEDIRVW